MITVCISHALPHQSMLLLLLAYLAGDLAGCIVLAEDSEVTARIVKAQLAKLGYDDVLLVSNGRDAVEAVQQRRVALVLSE